MEFLNGECWPEHEFFDLPEQINLDVLPEFNLSNLWNTPNCQEQIALQH